MRLFLLQYKHYLQLIRFYQPIGTLLLLFPCLWGGMVAGGMSSRLVLAFIVGAFAMRSAGCIINDMWDRKIDAQIERTKHRPLASGAVSLTEAFFLLAFFLMLGLFALLHLPHVVWQWAIYSVPLVIAYPLCKRFFFLPQLFLGFTFNWGALLGGIAVTGNVSLQNILLYIACVWWTLGYDTLYACQDKKDDAATGVRSSALTFGRHIKSAVFICYALFYLLLLLIGGMQGYNALYHIVLTIIFAVWGGHLSTWHPEQTHEGGRIFKENIWLAAGVTAALLWS